MIERSLRTMRLVTLGLICLLPTVASFVAPGGHRLTHSISSLNMSTPDERSGRRRKKSVADRTQAETRALIEDIIKTAVDAGPQAAPARTFQAYLAFSATLREFLPRPGRGMQTFSAPKALRVLFEKLGATYIKLGQFIASSPTICTIGIY